MFFNITQDLLPLSIKELVKMSIKFSIQKNKIYSHNVITLLPDIINVF
jgi:hypothetical protein